MSDAIWSVYIIRCADGSLYCGGSGTSYPGQFGGYILENEQIVPFVNANHGFNYARYSIMVTPQEVWSTYANGRFDLVEESAFGSVTAIMESIWSNRQSHQLMAAVGTFWQPLVPASNPYNPTGEDVNVARRLFETGGRLSTQDASSWRLVTGLEGEFNNGWNWDATYNYARWVDTRVHEGFINVPRVNTILDPDLCAATAGCPGVWDPFRVDTLTQEFQDYIQVDHSPVQRTQLESLQFNLAGDFGDIELPGGPIQWAAGIEHRKEEALFLPDGAGALGAFAAPCCQLPRIPFERHGDIEALAVVIGKTGHGIFEITQFNQLGRVAQSLPGLLGEAGVDKG